ncbi:uncharacterized protein RCO7_07655 [Rhynchosporium graminicola]|uniref:STEEP1 domain-containing protein n=1 Tax=Rhynchosporium graminicola TaxID=2792576 RepID=A0A1E1KZB5_9HELO|nr:uncharacterized protein RCO7_07655 [Rhynchosporium commune]
MAPPTIQTYHCLCTTLLIASTHTLSSLPRRSNTSSSSSSPHSDAALILPLPSSPPSSTNANDLPPHGHTTLLSLSADHKATLIRRDQGFEKRLLYRCGRCRLVVGYSLELPPHPPPSIPSNQTNMDMDNDSTLSKSTATEQEYDGKILYILPGGVTSTAVMSSGRKIGEGDVDIAFSSTGGGRKAVPVFE